jgi:translocation and assembly module TamB
MRGSRLLAALARGGGTTLLLLAAVVGGLLLHLNVNAVRRALVTRVNDVLASALAGRIVLDRVGALGVLYADDVDAHVDDPSGTTVLRVSGVDAHVLAVDLLQSLATGGDLRLAIDRLSVARADVDLDADEKGTLRIANAFAPRAPSSPPSTSGGGLRLSIPHGLLGHVTVHRRPGAGPPIDADIDGADASVSVAPGALALELRHAQLVARGLLEGVNLEGSLDARFAQPAPDGGDLFAHASWHGLVGQLAGTAEATYDAGRVDALVDVPPAHPDCVRTLWSSCPFGDTVAAHAEVHGALPRLLVTARASVGGGTVTVLGAASVADEVRANLRITAASIDAHALAPSAPSTELDAYGDAVLVAMPTQGAGAIVTLDFAGGTMGATRLPTATLRAQIVRDAAAGLTAEAKLAVHEPGAPATATLRFAHPSTPGSPASVGFDANVEVPRLDGVPRLGPVARGAARARVEGTVDLGTMRMEANGEARLDALDAGGVTLHDALLKVGASGPLSAPWVDLDLRGGGLVAGPLRFETLHAQLHGPPGSAPVKITLRGHGADFYARARVDLQGGTTLHEVELSMDRDGESAQARAELVAIGARETSVDDLQVYGLGHTLRATVRSRPGALLVQASSKGLDLARLGRLTGVTGLAGALSLDVDASLRPGAATGRVRLDLSRGSFAGWSDAQAHVDATLDGRHAAGRVTASMGDIGALDVTSKSLELGAAGPLAVSGWRTAWGDVDVSAHVDLDKLSAKLPKDALPGKKLAGTVTLQGHVERDSASDSTPDVDLTASTQGLALVGTPFPWRIGGMELTTHAHVDGNTGATAFDATVADAAGPLATLHASSEAVPYARLFTAAEPLTQALLAMPLQATLAVPPRDVTRLPAFLGTRGMKGTLQATVDLRGSVDKPEVEVKATVKDGKPEVTVLALPLDLALTAHYDGSRADAGLVAVSRGKQVLEASMETQVRMADVLGDWELPWTTSARVTLTDLPLQSIPAVDDRQVRGLASGTIELDGLHEDARASVALTLNNLQVGDVSCRPTTFKATASSRGIDASARIDEQDGYAEVRAHLGATWGKAMAPSPDASQASDVVVTARNFRAAVLLPFVSSVFTELDGRVDASARLQIDPANKKMTPEGTLSLTGGVFELSAMGSELHDATAKITLTPDGVVRLENVRARGLTGLVEAAASARFQGTELVGAHALVQVPRKQALPLVIDGTQMGLFDGRVDVTAARAADGMNVAVDVTGMRLQLPLASGHAVQTLGDIGGVRVGIARPGEFVPLRLDGGEAEVPVASARRTPLRLTVNLAKDTEVKRGADLDVQMEGSPQITVADTITAKGGIRLTHGTLNVKGKTFNIESGTVTFVDDPTNPQVVLKASWNAPDGTVVYANFVGPLKTGKVTLTSEPMLTNDRILSLLLYGTQDQQAAGGATAGTAQLSAASGVAGSAASENVNQALGGVNSALQSLGVGAQIATKLDTSEATPRPEVEVQIAQDLSFQIAWVLGVPPPGSNPDTTLFTLSWRFLQHWQAETTVGDAGTTILDLVWQHRY